VSTSTAVRLVLVVLLTTFSVLLAAWLLYRLQTIVVWSILALFLAVGLTPAVNWLASRRVPRALAILLMYLVLLIVVLAIGALVVPSLVQQSAQLLHALQQQGGLRAEAVRLAAPFGLGSYVKTLGPQLDAIPRQLASSAGSLFPTVTATTLSTVTAVLSVAVLGFFFIHDGAPLVDAALGLLPEGHRSQVRRVVDHSAAAISGYIRGNLAISAIAGISALVGMLVLAIPFALPLAVLLAVIDLIPMIGVTVGAVPVVLAALAVSPVKALILLVYIIVYQQIESNVLNPLIYGRTDQLPALTVFLAFLAGSLLWGILGALIAIPAANIIRIIVKEWSATHAAKPATPTDAELEKDPASRRPAS
jgi:predicted PurR-regulated permease PerM